MYPVAVVGNDICARTLILALRNCGFEDIYWAASGPPAPVFAYTLPANLSRIVIALGQQQALLEHGLVPSRDQVRLARSGYLISELPLGKFIHDRYGAPHINIDARSLEQILDVALPAPENTADPQQLSQQFNVVLQTQPDYEPGPLSHTLFIASIEHDEQSPAATREANIMWLGENQCAWQFSTRHQHHYQFAVPTDRSLAPRRLASQSARRIVTGDATDELFSSRRPGARALAAGQSGLSGHKLYGCQSAAAGNVLPGHGGCLGYEPHAGKLRRGRGGRIT